MNKKKIILSSILLVLSVVTLAIMAMPVIQETTWGAIDLAGKASSWYYMEEYLIGIAGLVSIICLPLLILSSFLSLISACCEIKNKAFNIVLFVVNIVLALLVFGVSVNYFLTLGRTIGMSGLKLFKGPTLFEYATPFFYLHCIFSLSMLVLACLNFSKKSK